MFVSKKHKIYGGDFMGLFDSLKKIGKEIGKEIEKTVESAAFKNVNNNTSGETGFNSTSKNTKEIPAEYSEFPRFRDIVTDLSTIETAKYIRCTMNFSNVTDQEISEYISKINSLGYVRGSNVRFDKGNTYIIVDNKYGDLNLVFHIKR